MYGKIKPSRIAKASFTSTIFIFSNLSPRSSPLSNKKINKSYEITQSYDIQNNNGSICRITLQPQNK